MAAGYYGRAEVFVYLGQQTLFFGAFGNSGRKQRYDTLDFAGCGMAEKTIKTASKFIELL